MGRRRHCADRGGGDERETNQTENWEEEATGQLTTVASGWAAARAPAVASCVSSTRVGPAPDTSGLVVVGVRVSLFARRQASDLPAALARLIVPPGVSARRRDSTAMFNHAAQARLGEGVATLMSVPVGALRTAEIVKLLKQQAEPERPMWVTALGRARVSGDRTVLITLLLQENPEIASSR
jgi:hypothetical protein